MSHRRTHVADSEGAEQAGETEDCGDGVKCEKETVERKPEIRYKQFTSQQASFPDRKHMGTLSVLHMSLGDGDRFPSGGPLACLSYL